MNARRLLPCLLLAIGLSPLSALAGESITQCVSLGNDQEIVRVAGGQQIFLRDGQTHYRVGFARSCDSVTMTPTIEIVTDGQLNQLCPQNTKVRTKGGNCQVDEVEMITAEQFATRKRRSGR